VNSSEKVSAEGNVRALFLVNHIHAPSHNSNRSMKHVSAPFYGVYNVVSAPFNIFEAQKKKSFGTQIREVLKF